MSRVYRLLIMAIVLSALSLSACGGGASQPPSTTDSGSSAGETGSNPEPAKTLNRDPKTLVVVYSETADNMDPGQTLNVANNAVQRGIYEGLLRLKGSSVSEVEGVLAESWTTNEAKSEWTFKIRQGVKFHDGSACDAQAIYDSMARTLVNTLPASFILARFMGYEPDKVMKVVDPYTLQFNFPEPQPLFDLGLAAAYGTYIISPKAFKENEKAGDAGKEWLTTHAAGTGAYKLEKFAPNDEFILVRNPDYWRGWPDPDQFEKIIIKPIPEASTRRQILEKGDADIAPGFTNPEDMLALEQTGLFNIGDEGQIRIDYALYNPHGKLKDPRTR